MVKRGVDPVLLINEIGPGVVLGLEFGFGSGLNKRQGSGWFLVV